MIKEIEFINNFPPFKKGGKIWFWNYNNQQKLIRNYLKQKDNEEKEYWDNIKIDVIVGNNGAGKSRLFEAIYWSKRDMKSQMDKIFCSFDDGKEINNISIILDDINIFRENKIWYISIHKNIIDSIGSSFPYWEFLCDAFNFLQKGVSKNILNFLKLKKEKIQFKTSFVDILNNYNKLVVPANKALDYHNKLLDCFKKIKNKKVSYKEFKIFLENNEFVYYNKQTFEQIVLEIKNKIWSKCDKTIKDLTNFYDNYPVSLPDDNNKDYKNRKDIICEYIKKHHPETSDFLYSFSSELQNLNIILSDKVGFYYTLYIFGFLWYRVQFIAHKLWPQDENYKLLFLYLKLHLLINFNIEKTDKRIVLLEEIESLLEIFNKKRETTNDWINFEEDINKWCLILNEIFWNLKDQYYNNSSVLVKDFYLKKKLSKIEKKLFSKFFKSTLVFTNQYDSNNKSFFNLSSWEKMLFVRFINIYKEIEEQHKKNNKKDFLVLIDEPDLHLHLDRQRQYIQKLIDVFSSLSSDINLHFILATHSPFIISDVPKENVILLRSGKDEDEDEKDKEQTFWANYIDLIRNWFFFKNKNLMWSFAEAVVWNIAQQRREEITNSKKIDDDDIEEIENMIWDGFLKDHLLYFRPKE